MNKNLTDYVQETRDPIKKKVIDKIQEGRLLMGLDMVVRTATGDVADETNTGVIPLYRMVFFFFFKKMGKRNERGFKYQELARWTTVHEMDRARRITWTSSWISKGKGAERARERKERKITDNFLLAPRARELDDRAPDGPRAAPAPHPRRAAQEGRHEPLPPLPGFQDLHVLRGRDHRALFLAVQQARGPAGVGRIPDRAHRAGHADGYRQDGQIVHCFHGMTLFNWIQNHSRIYSPENSFNFFVLEYILFVLSYYSISFRAYFIQLVVLAFNVSRFIFFFFHLG